MGGLPAAPNSLCLSPLLQGLRHCLTVGVEDVDGGGDAAEEDGTCLPLPTPGDPHMLVVPGAVPASPR